MTQPARIDVDALKARIDLEDVIQACGVELRRQGTELAALCPFHSEKTPSFKVTPKTQLYYCAGCGAGGDSIAFLREFYGIGFRDAAERLSEIAGGGLPTNDNEPQQRASRRAEAAPPKWLKDRPPSNPPAPPEALRVLRGGEWVTAPVVSRWAYRDRAGQLVGYTCRIEFEKPGGGVSKDVIPLTWQVNTETGESAWRQGAFEEPRPLYGAELLDAAPDAPVILVEGEKACDAARRMAADNGPLVLTWAGGCKAVEKADWSVLAGRRVIAWPDTDSQRDRDGNMRPYLEQPGMAAMLRIAEIVGEHGATTEIIEVARPGEREDGWDAADAEAEGWGWVDVETLISEAGRTPDQLLAEAAHIEPENSPPPADDEPPPPAEEPPARAKREKRPPRPPRDPEAGMGRAAPVRPLGYNQGRYYYLSANQRQVHEYAKHDHSTNGLLQLAPLAYWSRTFGDGGDKMKSEWWQTATDALMRQCERAGIFDTDIIRGRGCWTDQGRMVLNLGDRIVVDGQSMAVDKIESDAIYEAGPRLRGPVGEPLTVQEARRVLDIALRFNWEMKASAALLAGWIVLAPLCGALRWRPHIWLTGGTGTGKTTILNDFIAPLMAGMDLQVQGNSTEAGIRQRLRADARPVIFDESEQNDEREESRIQNVLALVRQSSSESQSRTLKGTTSGRHLEFHIRSMFCLASIQVGIKRQADHTRISVLGLYGTSQVPSEDMEAHQAKWLDTERMLADLRDDTDYGNRLMARSVKLLPVIRENMRTLVRVAATKFRNQRLGDQYGTLLAGTAALLFDHVIDEKTATGLIDRFDWSTFTEAAREDEAVEALAAIMQIETRVELDNGTRQVTVGELVRIAADGYDAEKGIGMKTAATHLGRLGIKVEPAGAQHPGVYVANKSERLQKALRGAPWAADWRSYLRRIRGAKSWPTVIRFCDGHVGRATLVPIEAALPDGA